MAGNAFGHCQTVVRDEGAVGFVSYDDQVSAIRGVSR